MLQIKGYVLNKLKMKNIILLLTTIINKKYIIYRKICYILNILYNPIDTSFEVLQNLIHVPLHFEL